MQVSASNYYINLTPENNIIMPFYLLNRKCMPFARGCSMPFIRGSLPAKYQTVIAAISQTFSLLTKLCANYTNRLNLIILHNTAVFSVNFSKSAFCFWGGLLHNSGERPLAAGGKGFDPPHLHHIKPPTCKIWRFFFFWHFFRGFHAPDLPPFHRVYYSPIPGCQTLHPTGENQSQIQFQSHNLFSPLPVVSAVTESSFCSRYHTHHTYPTTF